MIDTMPICQMSRTPNRYGNKGLDCTACRTMKSMPTSPAEDYVMKSDSKIKLSEDDFVLVGMNYNYYMIPRLAYPKDELKSLKGQILKNQKMIEELKSVWDDGVHGMFADDVAGIMEKYFGKRTK